MTTCSPRVGDQTRRHRLERAGEEQIQEQGLDEVIEVMPKRDLGRADLGGNPIQHSASEPGTQRTGSRVRFEDVVHDLADRGVLDAVLPASFLAGPCNEVVFELLVAGIDIDGDERKVDRGPPPQLIERLQERPAVFAARQSHHDAVAVLDQLEIDDGFGGLLGDPIFETAAVRHKCWSAYLAADWIVRPWGGSDAMYAAIAIISSAVSFSTTGFMSCDQTPFRVPICMSYS